MKLPMLFKKIASSPLFFVVFSLIVLFLGYSENLWKAANTKKHFEKKYSFLRNLDIPESQNFPENYWTFDRYSESLVLGRLVKSRKDGLLSSGGLVGRFLDYPHPPADITSGQYRRSYLNMLDTSNKFSHAYQYKIYFDESLDNKVNRFVTYNSQSGGQAFVLGIFDKIIPGTNAFKLKFFYRLTALLTTLAVFLIIFWFYREFGVYTGWFLVFCFAFFSYPTLSAKSIWWVPWAFYIPFLLILYSFYMEDISCKKLSFLFIFLLSFSGMLIKIFLNGFEFISSTIVMAAIPLFYYDIKNKWGLRKLIYRLIAFGGGVALSCIISIILLSFQFVLAGETFSDGIYHIYNVLLKRTYITISPTYEESVSAPVYNVVAYYITKPPIINFSGIGIYYSISIKYFLLVFLAVTLIWLFFIRRLRINGDCIKINALTATLWISILAPLSWFVLFKAHSSDHKLQDPIVWFMPFMFYGIGLLGITAEKFVRAIWFSKRM